ncbi:MAG TPA: hypothetical protein VM253_00030 [Candidatus Limnocylindrales bacterium]|nr:hypothetical protein [Candidatus Limnocylindrales bacterium]
MRWLRPTVSHHTPEEAIDDVARVLEAAAHEAPPPRRAEEIRQALLDDMGTGRWAVPGLVPLALAGGVLLLALLVGVGGPAVGSWVVDQLDRTPASPDAAGPDGTADPSVPQLPLNEDPAMPTRGELPSEAATPSPSAAPASGVAEPSPATAPSTAPAGPAAPDPTPDDDGTPAPPAPSVGPPSPMPTPPATGPPPGTPGG